MASFKIVSLALLASFVFLAMTTNAEDLQVGSTVNGILAYSEDVELSSWPLKVRTKNVFYNDDKNRTLKGISAIDKDKSEARVTVTSGGVGFTFANVLIKSQKGDGLNYQVQFFV
ncbi:uncharacterized protein LOC125226326 [Leguminivora glycinivorella]|uniref:uncharacterized protein LOC125226326 n=1 Tax=Leguminivora glycinivorella TaxID=1035111 RepID=UPI00200E4609|nr:uncharacterized protein LOC125226326 [Leguminivora glycinivorella]